MGEGGGHTTTVIIILVVIGALALLSAPIMQGILGIMKDMTDVTKDISDSVKELVDLLTGIINNIVQSCTNFTGACMYFEIFGGTYLSYKFLALFFKGAANVAAFFRSDSAKRVKSFFTDPTKTKLYSIAELDAALRGQETDVVYRPLAGDAVSRLKDIKQNFDNAFKEKPALNGLKGVVVDTAMAKFVSDKANELAKRQGGTDEQKAAVQQIQQEQANNLKATFDRYKAQRDQIDEKERGQADEFMKENGMDVPS